ncbi:hypothetical protein Q9B79_00190 [Bacillus sp. MHSD_36]|uniref:hypothetical protein n=1 Tax=unclassified Bacillus (in: firmicutes) TaxID=185979 RepID=UPI0027418535|nr:MULTISPECIES: hypothetical protein [unclassified Bacillus (in: firmicutes)]MDP7988250.1 hypothetical protein [Bacillus sp. MHSD_36]MDR4978473.1 hypothetical protein [Bacillus sp. MHSD_37]
MITGTDWAIVVGFFVTAISGVIVQLASHYLTKIREEKKYQKECYQTLFSPIVFKVIKYIQAENVRGFKEKPDKLFKEIIDHLGLNIKYAAPRFVMKYENFRHVDFKLDSHEMKDYYISERIKLCEEFLLDYLQISNKLEVLTPDVKRLIDMNLMICKLHDLAWCCYCYEIATLVLERGIFIQNLFTNYNYQVQEIEEIIKELNNNIEYSQKQIGCIQFHCFQNAIEYIENICKTFINKYPQEESTFQSALNNGIAHLKEKHK